MVEPEVLHCRSSNTEPGAVATGFKLRYRLPSTERIRGAGVRAIEEAIRETCRIRKWDFWTTNVRTNHIHTVVSAQCKPEVILAAFKANATRKLREAGCWHSSRSPWVDRGSKKYLWTEADVINAVAYVDYDQGEPLD